MTTLVEFSMAPLDKGDSVGPYVARCVRVVRASGIDHELHAMGTILEGTWDECFAVIGACQQALAQDCARISVTIKVDHRRGDTRRLREKVRSVEALLGGPEAPAA